MRKARSSGELTTLHAPVCGNVLWRCRDGQAERLPTGQEAHGQMQQRPPRAVDQGRRLLDFKLPYVSFTQVELDSLLNWRTRACASIAGEESIPITRLPVA